MNDIVPTERDLLAEIRRLRHELRIAWAAADAADADALEWMRKYEDAVGGNA